MGDSKSPMYFIAVACAANITLDYLSWGALKMGPAGAALGNNACAGDKRCGVTVMVLRQKTGIALRREDLKPNRDMMGQLLSIGVPIAVQDGLIQVAFIIITIIANRRGLTDAAAVGIVEKFISFVFLVPSSMLSTVSALGAQNIGANKPERAVATLRYAVMIAAGFGVIVTILIQFIAESIVGLFTPDAAVISAGGQYLRGYIFDCIFAGIHFSFSGYFCACGKSGLSFMHNIIAVALVRVPGVYFTSKLFPCDTFADGACDGGGLSRVGHHMRDRIRGHKPPRESRCGRGVTGWKCRSCSRSGIWQSCSTSASAA